MSRNVITIGIAVTVAVSFMFVGFGGVAAHGEEDVGASGNCSDSSNGGGGEVGASTDGSYNGTDASEAESTARGVGHYAQERPGDDRGDACDNDDPDHDSDDWLEVHAGDFQVCYSEDNEDENGDYTTSGDDACH